MIAGYAHTLDKLYISQEARNGEACRLKSLGYAVKRRTVRNQRLHPEYIEDSPRERQIQRGFGNDQYLSFWSVLYQVEYAHPSSPLFSTWLDQYINH